MKVYQTQCNSDMVEGKGAMVPSLTFLHRKDAESYIDTKEGVWGIRKKWSQERYGDWIIKEIDVLEYDVVEAEKHKLTVKAAALAKLTSEEIEALGLLGNGRD